MFDISLKKIVLGTAVVGGMAVASYYAYKWITTENDTENKQEITGKFNDATIQIVKDARRKARERAVIDPKTALLSKVSAGNGSESTVGKFNDATIQIVKDARRRARERAVIDPKTALLSMIRAGKGFESTVNMDSENDSKAQLSRDSTKVTEDPSIHSVVTKPDAELGSFEETVNCETQVDEEMASGLTTSDHDLAVTQTKNDEKLAKCENVDEVLAMDAGGSTEPDETVACGKTDTVEAMDKSTTDEQKACGNAEAVDKVVKVAKAEDKPDILKTLPRGEWGSNIMHNGFYVPGVLQTVRTQRDLEETLEALCAYLFKLPHTQEDLLETELNLGWVYHFAYTFLYKVPEVVPDYTAEDGMVTYGVDGQPMEAVD